MFYLGLDLGQRRDHTAIAIIEKIESRRPWGESIFLALHLRHAERVPLGTSYPAIVERIRTIVSVPELRDNVNITVDATGVGAPVVDLLRQANLGCHITPVSITGGDKASLVGTVYNVPKVDLWAGLAIMLEREQLVIAKKLPCSAAIARELGALSSHTLRAAPGEKDDLAIAIALAVWKARRSGCGTTSNDRTQDYDPVLRYHCRL